MRKAIECIEKCKEFYNNEKSVALEELIIMHTLNVPMVRLKQQSNYHSKLCMEYQELVMQELKLLRPKYFEKLNGNYLG